jgi:hypothetical protein
LHGIAVYKKNSVGFDFQWFKIHHMNKIAIVKPKHMVEARAVRCRQNTRKLFIRAGNVKYFQFLGQTFFKAVILYHGSHRFSFWHYLLLSISAPDSD